MVDRINMIRYLKKYKLWCILITVLAIFLSGMDIFKGIILQIIVDTSIGELNYSFLYILVIIIGFVILNFLVCFLFQKSVYGVCSKAVCDIKNDIVHVIIFKHQEDNSYSNMDLLSLLNKDMDIILDKYLINIFMLIKMLMAFLLSVVYLFAINFSLTIIILFLGSISAILPNLFIKKSRYLKQAFSQKNSVFFNSAKELLYGMDTIKLYGLEQEYYEKGITINSQFEKIRAKMLFFDSSIQIIGSCVSFLVLAANVVFAGYLSFKGYFSIGTVLAIMQVMNYVLAPLNQGPVYYAEIKSVNAIIKKINDYTGRDIVAARDDFMSNVKTIKIKNLSFKYLVDLENTLSNINIEFIAPKKYIVTGTSGCGKSTLFKLLSALNTKYTGEIIINGNDSLRQISACSWRKQIAVVQQDIFLFDNTVRYNICLNKFLSDDEIKQIIEMVGLTDFVASLPNGIDSLIGENGSCISGGEKQRIAIARALAKKTNILLIDEATSSLDAKNTSNIENIILSLHDKLVIYISHKYDENLLNKFDEVIVMEKGCITFHGEFKNMTLNLDS
jgi:ATP-binding cassette subfamily C protein